MARAVLYARVSTEDQADRYSLEGQLSELREYAANQGYEVVAEITDPGGKRDSLDRHGIDRLLELVTPGDIDAVIAWKRDRYGESPIPATLASLLIDYGCKMRSMDDSGEGDEAEFMNDIKDAVAKLERRKTAARARMGKLSKARQGKIIANSQADYGFRYNEARDGYEVDEETAPVVRRIFDLVASGETIHGIALAFDREGVPTAGNAKHWATTYIRKCIIRDDVYKPHSFDEVAELVTPEVAARLDPEKSYGVFWTNRYSTKTKQEKVEGTGENGTDPQYKRRHIIHERPRDEWIAVPVPDVGVPAETVQEARLRLEDKRRWPSKNTDRFWELSSGVAVCAECGRWLAARRRVGRGDKRYFYYGCRYAGHKLATCNNNKNVPAEKLESRVADFVSDLLSDESRLVSEIDALIEKERKALHDPEPEARALETRQAEITTERDGYVRLAARGRITDTDLDSYLAELDSEAATIKDELSRVEGKRERIRELERDKEELIRAYRQRAESGGLAEFTPEQRREIYQRLRLEVRVGLQGHVAVTGDIPLAVSSLGSPLAVVFDDDNSYLEESEDGDGYEGEVFFRWQSGRRAISK